MLLLGLILYDKNEIDEGHVFAYYGSSSGLSNTPSWTGESDRLIPFLEPA
jgi:hypothetical protein